MSSPRIASARVLVAPPTAPSTLQAVANAASVAPQATAAAVTQTQTPQAAAVMNQVVAQQPNAAAQVVSSAVNQDPWKTAQVVAQVSQQQPEQARKVVAQVASQNPLDAAKLVAAMAPKHPWDALALTIGAVAGSRPVQQLGMALNARTNMKTIVSATRQVTHATVNEKQTFVAATHQALKANAEQAREVDASAKLNGWGRLGSTLSVLGGANSVLNLPTDVKRLAGHRDFANTNTVAADALGIVRGADAATKLVRNSQVGFMGARALPIISIAADASDVANQVMTLKHANCTSSQTVAAAASLTGDTLDAAGSALLLSGVGLPLGAALKLASAGTFVFSLLASHWTALKGLIPGMNKPTPKAPAATPPAPGRVLAPAAKQAGAGVAASSPLVR